MIRLDDLKIGDYKIYQDSTLYNFSTDAVLLANFASCKKSDVVFDFCSGNGIVGILMSIKNSYKKIYLVELQECLYNLAKQSVEYNKLENVECLNIKVQNLINNFKYESADVVVCNPPYRKSEEHFISKNEHLNICNYELEINLEEIIISSKNLLKFGGKLFMVNDINRLEETIVLLNKNGFKTKKLQIVQPKKDKASNVFLIEAVKGAKSGIKVLPTLILNDENGNYLPKVKPPKNKQLK